MKTITLTFLLTLSSAFSQSTFDTTLSVLSSPFGVEKYDIDSLWMYSISIDLNPVIQENSLSGSPGSKTFYLDSKREPYEDEFMRRGTIVRSIIYPMVFEHNGDYVLMEGLNMIYNDSSFYPDSISLRFTEGYDYISTITRLSRSSNQSFFGTFTVDGRIQRNTQRKTVFKYFWIK